MPLWTKVLRRQSRLAPEPDPNAPIPLLAIAPPGDDRRALECIAEKAGWEPVFVETCADAVRLLRARAFPVVLHDRDLPGGDWRQVLRTVISTRPGACAILASRVIDAYLWEEVVRHGGFDLLSKPYREDQVLRVLRFALSHWNSGWARGGCRCFRAT